MAQAGPPFHLPSDAPVLGAPGESKQCPSSSEEGHSFYWVQPTGRPLGGTCSVLGGGVTSYPFAVLVEKEASSSQGLTDPGPSTSLGGMGTWGFLPQLSLISRVTDQWAPAWPRAELTQEGFDFCDSSFIGINVQLLLRSAWRGSPSGGHAQISGAESQPGALRKGPGLLRVGLGMEPGQGLWVELCRRRPPEAPLPRPTRGLTCSDTSPVTFPAGSGDRLGPPL